MSKRQQTILTFFLTRSLYFGFGLSYIVHQASDNSSLAMILGMIIGGIILFWLTKKDFSVLYKSKIGMLAIISLSTLLLTSAVIYFTVLTSNFYLTHTSPLMIIFPLMLVILYAMKKGLATVARLGEILIIIAAILIGVIFLAVTPMITWTNFLPIKLTFNYRFFLSILATTVRSVGPIILLLSLVKDYDRKAIMTGYFLGSITIINTLINTIGVLGSTLISLYRYPEYVILNKIAVLNFLEKIENFLALVWFIDILIGAFISILALRKLVNEKLMYILAIIFTIFCIYVFINDYSNSILLWHITTYIILVPSLIAIILTKRKRPNQIDLHRQEKSS